MATHMQTLPSVAELQRKFDEFAQSANDVMLHWAKTHEINQRLMALINSHRPVGNQAFQQQYLALQQQMQDESRRFTLLSNIMKTKHDTAKNSINNLR